MSLEDQGYGSGFVLAYLSELTSTPSFLPQGNFPDTDTADDGYHGVSPVTAFPAQNNYGKEAFLWCMCRLIWLALFGALNINT